MSTHVKVIAVLFMVIGAILIISAVFASLVFGVISGVVGASGEENAALGVAILGLTGAALTVVLLVLAVPYIICGWGLFKFRPWARILGIILAAIALTKIPFGTIFGIYALVILFRKDTETLFNT